MKYILRELAEQDLQDIWLYTFNEWDIERADTYLTSLMNRFEWLCGQPGSGRKRDDVKEGYFSFPEGEHVIFYTMTDGIVDIIGIPHHSMDIVSHFGAED
jgi:toxin ParE1/3/4